MQKWNAKRSWFLHGPPCVEKSFVIVYFLLLIFFCNLMTLGVNFINVILAALALADPKSIKKDSQVVSSFYAFGICACKSCT